MKENIKHNNKKSVDPEKIPIETLQEMMLKHYTINDLTNLLNDNFLKKMQEEELKRANIEKVKDEASYNLVALLYINVTALTTSFSKILTNMSNMLRKYEACIQGCNVAELGQVACVICHRNCKCVNQICCCSKCDNLKSIKKDQHKADKMQRLKDAINGVDL
jgi:hypothetical protein